MKTRWKFSACGATLLALSLGGGVPQGRAQDSNTQDHEERGGQNHEERGQNGQYNRGEHGRNRRSNRHENQARESENVSRGSHARFDERDRQSTRAWYNQNHTQGAREQERLNSDEESRLQDGYVLDRSMRRMARRAPGDLTRNLGRPPRGYRYMLVNGHVVMVDRNYRVHDVIHLEQ